MTELERSPDWFFWQSEQSSDQCLVFLHDPVTEGTCCFGQKVHLGMLQRFYIIHFFFFFFFLIGGKLLFDVLLVSAV